MRISLSYETSSELHIISLFKLYTFSSKKAYSFSCVSRKTFRYYLILPGIAVSVSVSMDMKKKIILVALPIDFLITIIVIFIIIVIIHGIASCNHFRITSAVRCVH